MTRPPFSKLHLANSPEPLELGTTLTALCGKEVEHAEAKFMFDCSYSELHLPWTTISTCSGCLRAPMLARYLYGIVSAPTEEASNLSGEERGEDVAF